MRRLIPSCALLLCGGLMFPPAAVAADKTPPVTMTRAQCQALVDYSPDPGLAYRAGVDVNGHPVAPADLPSNRAAPPGQIVIDLKRPLRQFVPAGNEAAIGTSQAHLGLVTVDIASGQVDLDGRPLELGRPHV